MKTLITIFILSLAFTPCSASTPSKSEVSTLIKKAEKQRIVAKEAKVEFLKTKKFIKEAKEALKAGKLQEAYDKANRAYVGSVRAIEQKKVAQKEYLLAIPK